MNDTPKDAMKAEWTYSRSGHQFKVLDPEGDTLIFVHAEAVAQIITDALNELDKLKHQFLTAEVPEVVPSECDIDRMARPDLSELNEDACFETGARAMRLILLPYIQRLVQRIELKDEKISRQEDTIGKLISSQQHLQSENERLSELNEWIPVTKSLPKDSDGKILALEYAGHPIVTVAREEDGRFSERFSHWKKIALLTHQKD